MLKQQAKSPQEAWYNAINDGSATPYTDEFLDPVMLHCIEVQCSMCLKNGFMIDGQVFAAVKEIFDGLCKSIRGSVPVTVYYDPLDCRTVTVTAINTVTGEQFNYLTHNRKFGSFSEPIPFDEAEAYRKNYRKLKPHRVENEGIVVAEEKQKRNSKTRSTPVDLENEPVDIQTIIDESGKTITQNKPLVLSHEASDEVCELLSDWVDDADDFTEMERPE